MQGYDIEKLEFLLAKLCKAFYGNALFGRVLPWPYRKLENLRRKRYCNASLLLSTLSFSPELYLSSTSRASNSCFWEGMHFALQYFFFIILYCSIILLEKFFILIYSFGGGWLSISISRRVHLRLWVKMAYPRETSVLRAFGTCFFFKSTRTGDLRIVSIFFHFLNSTQWRCDFKAIPVFCGLRRVFLVDVVFANADDLLRWMTKMFSVQR